MKVSLFVYMSITYLYLKLAIMLCMILKVRLDRTYFVETKNWKHYSKIIFKCVNSTMGLIFNEKVAEKWDLWVSWIVHGTHWCVEKSNITAIVHEQCMNSSSNSVICS